MRMDESTHRRLVRDAAISLLIYLLPPALMLFSFLVTGQRPWKKPPPVGKQTIITAKHVGDLK